MICLIVFLLLLLQSPATNTASEDNNFPFSELKALQDLYYNTNGPYYWTWKQNGGKKWNFTEGNPNPCYEQWEGIECTSNCLGSSLCNVKNISLVDYNLTGVLSSSIGNFHELQWLNLRSNVINCPIPTEITNLTKLIVLDLSHNNLYGLVPVSVGQLINLEVLSLVNNILSGNISNSIGNLTNLQILRLGRNLLKSQIPQELGNLQRLTILDLAFNKLSGTVPESLMKLKELEILELSVNKLHGTVPRSIYHLPKLRQLDLYSNNLISGSIPVDIGNLTELRVLILGRNSFTGTIPDTLCALSKLEVLDLNANLFVGRLPVNITNLTKLRILYVAYNSLSGPIPPTLFKHLTELRVFALQYNYFEGKLPNSIIQHSSLLELFRVGYNELSGYLPDSIAFCKNLTYLNMRGNYFVGSIPAEYGNLRSLMAWYLFNNLMTGTIPSNITSLTNLADLELEYNTFSGTIPEAMGDLHRLMNLGLNDNFFHGSLPQSLGNMNNLLAATFQHNKFTATLPSVIARNWFNLEVLLLQNNLFSGSIDVIANMHNLTNINVSTNRFSGSFSHIMMDFPLLYSFDVSSNKFTGSLHHVFDQMPSLINKNVAHNQFSGNLNDIFVSGVLTLVDISDNIFSGTLPADVFNIMTLRTFAAVKNCLTGTLPTDVICNSKSLHTLALDGLHTAEHCQDRFFPAFPSISSYQLVGALKGSLPECLFSMSSLQTLHLSGNGFTGSIPANVVANQSLLDVSLSYNQLTGIIPDWMQEKVWKNLDVSFNKLNGVLKNTFAVPDNSTSLTMIVNRLSGDIPASLLTTEHIDMLQGNIFRCDASGMLGDASRSLPNADAEFSTYDCGSDSVNTAMYIWLIVIGSVLVGIIAVVAISNNICCTHERVIMEGEQPVRCPVGCSKFEKIAVNIQDQLRRCQSNIDTLLNIYKKNDHIIPSNGNEVKGQCENVQEEKDLNPMFLLGKSLTMIRTLVLRISAFSLFLLLPLYCILANSFSTHSHVYIWTVALAYLSGWVPAVAVFVIMVIFYIFLGSRLTHDSSFYLHRQHHSNSFDRLYSYIAFQHFTRADIKKFYVYVGIVLFDVVIVLAVNVAYVYTTTLSLSQSAILFVEITISLFKITWSSFVVSYVFSRMLKTRTRNCANDDEQTATANHHMIERLKFLSQLTIFNNIIAPFLADAFVDPDCFRYVINSQSSVTASYNTGICYIYDFVSADGNTLKLNCLLFVPTSISTTYNPPFVYSYQCSSALLNRFINVFIYRYLLTGVLLPLMRMLLLYLDDQYGIVDVPYRSFSNTMKKFEATNSRRQKVDVDVEENQQEKEIQLQTLVNNPAVVTTLNPILIEEQENIAAIEKGDTKIQEGNPTISVQAASEKLILQRVFNKEAIIIAIIGDFAVLLTFGLTFPPLAMMITVSIVSNTYYHQLTLSRMLTMLQVIIVKPVMTSSLHTELNLVQTLTLTPTLRWWYVSKATMQLLTPSEAESIFKRIIADCGGDLMQLFWPIIPSLAILSAVFIGAFLFDILGDEVGMLQALWILLVMGTMPLWIWCGEYLYFTYKNKCVQHQQQEQQDEVQEFEIQQHKELE